jgi:actin-like ATPase involved in cell morphogenesis
VSSVVFLGEGGQVVVGEAAERRAVTDPDRVVRGFKRRIGDEVPMMAGGVAYAAPEIAAMVVRWVVERVAAREGGPAAGIVLTHPAGWGAYKIESLARALRAADLGQVRFATEPEAAAAGYAVQERVEPGRTIAVYDLGGGTFDAAVVRKTEAGGFCVLGQPQGLEQLGGADFDDAVFAHVLAAVPALAKLDGEDPAVLAASAVLRRECTEAKEALSADTDVTIPVLAPGIQSQVRLVRAEFEDMIRTQVSETVQALRRTLQSAQLEPDELDVVLLVGGSSRVPLVAQLVSAELGRPVAVDADPKVTIALGAALLALPAAGTPDVPPTDHTLDQHEPPADPPTPHSPLPAPTPLPERPALTAIPLDVEVANTGWRRSNSRRVKRAALAGALALVTAAGVASVPFLTAHSDPTLPATASPTNTPSPVKTGVPPGLGAPELATSPPGAASPIMNAGASGDASSHRAGLGGGVRTTPPAAPPPARGGAKPDPVVSSGAQVPPWVTTYTWTTSWSSPSPTPSPTTNPTPRPTTSSTASPTTTRETPTPTPTRTTAPPPATSSPHPERPRT